MADPGAGAHRADAPDAEPTETPTARLQPGLDPGSDPGGRGGLVIRPTAVQKIAERAARGVPGTASRTGNVARLRRASFPNVTVDVVGSRALIYVEAAARWPAAVTDLGARVRDEVLEQTTRLTGLVVSGVDVRMVLLDAKETMTRRVQ